MSAQISRRKIWQRMLAFLVFPNILIAQAKQSVPEESDCVRIYHLFGNTARQRAISKAWLLWKEQVSMEIPEDQKPLLTSVALQFGNYVFDHADEIKQTEARLRLVSRVSPWCY